MKPIAMLPETGIPPSNFPPNCTAEWQYADNLDEYRKQGGHPLYGEHDIIYRYNSLGYRSAEFDVDADMRIIAIGCSYAQGHALPQGAIFHERFAAKLRQELERTVVLWNLAQPGSSNDYICRLLFQAIPYLDPDIVLINFTHGARREYLSVQEERQSYNPTSVPRDMVGREIHSHFAALSSPPDDQLNFYRNYKALELLLANRHWLFSHIQPDDFARVVDHVDLARFVGRLTHIDRARDKQHPGPAAHEDLFQRYWARFVERGWLQDYATRVRKPA